MRPITCGTCHDAVTTGLIFIFSPPTSVGNIALESGVTGNGTKSKKEEQRSLYDNMYYFIVMEVHWDIEIQR